MIALKHVIAIGRLEELAVRHAMRCLGLAGYSPESQADPMTCFYLWAYTHLRRLPFLGNERHGLVFDSLLAQRALMSPVPLVAESGGAFLLGFADRTFFTHTGLSGHVDLRTGAAVAHLPQPPFETVVYDLVVQYRENVRRCEKLEQGHKNESTSQDGSESGLGTP